MASMSGWKLLSPDSGRDSAQGTPTLGDLRRLFSRLQAHSKRLPWGKGGRKWSEKSYGCFQAFLAAQRINPAGWVTNLMLENGKVVEIQGDAPKLHPDLKHEGVRVISTNSSPLFEKRLLSPEEAAYYRETKRWMERRPDYNPELPIYV